MRWHTTCHHCVSDSSQTSYSQHSPVAANEVAFLLEKAHHMENAIRSVSEERAAALQRVNEICSFTSVLPRELLATIFKFACPPPLDLRVYPFCDSEYSEDEDNVACMAKHTWSHGMWEREDLRYRYFPLVLGAVSREWRQVAWSHPQLWNALAIEVVWEKIPRQAALLRLYLHNAKAVPVTLDIDFRRYQKEMELVEERRLVMSRNGYPCHNADALGAIIFDEFPERIGTLRLAEPPIGWVYAAPWKLSRMEHFSFGWDYQHNHDNLDFRLTPPSLRALKIFRFQSEIGPIPSSVTTIHLECVRLDICAYILCHCPQLVEYHSIHPTSSYYSHGKSSLPPWVTRPFVLGNMRSFGWTRNYDRNGWDIAVLRNIRLPGLQRLKWGSEPEADDPEWIEVIENFFSRLPKTVLTLGLYGFSYQHQWRFPNLQSLLYHLSNVEELEVSRSSNRFLNALFMSLARPPLQTCHRRGATLVLPRLERIRVHPLVRDISLQPLGDDFVIDSESYYLENDDTIGSEREVAIDCATWERNHTRYYQVPVEPFVQMLESRRDMLGLSDFHLDLSGSWLKLDHETRKKLKAMIQEGFGLEIVEGLRDVNRVEV